MGLLSRSLLQSPTMDMDTVVATMAGMATEDTGERRNDLLRLSLTQLLNLNLMDMATMATTGLMDTGCGRKKRSAEPNAAAEPEPHGYGYYGYYRPYGYWGWGKKKRSAEPDPYYGYGYGYRRGYYGGYRADTGAEQKGEQGP